MSELRTYPEGVPSWVDCEAPDPEAARAFYGDLFGWSYADRGVPYRFAALGGRDVAGIGPGDRARWSTYIAVDDADAAVARITDAGGALVSAPATAGESGRAATVTDATGAEVRLWEAAAHPGAQLVNEPGSWNFSDLRTADGDAATAFYRTVFGWELSEMGYWRRPGYADHLAATIDPGIHERHAAVTAPPGFADAVAWLSVTADEGPSHWNVTFAVADRDAAAATAERLGATVLASEETPWTRTAQIRDPQGAELTLGQFTPPG